MRMTAEDAIDVLNDGLSALSNAVHEDARTRLLAMARRSLIEMASDSPQTRDLARTMAPYRPLVLDEAMQAVSRRTVISIPLPLCNAVARHFRGEECIFLFDGLLDAATATIAMSYAVKSLPPVFDEVRPFSGVPELSARGWMSVILSCLVNRFIQFAEPMPDFRLLIRPPGFESEIRHALVGTAWWMLLHEVAHFELGHMASGARRSRPAISEDLLVGQTLSETQREELEADAFVLRCLSDAGRELAYSWANYALGPQMMLENLSSQQSETHPLSINRIDRILAAVRPCQVAEEAQAKAHLQKHGDARASIRSAHERIRQAGQKPFFELSSEALLRTLEGMRGVFEAAELPFDRLLASQGFGWRAAMDLPQQ
ncbi:hypothetical protein LJR039_007088 [Pseudorhodoferax sp. LjRoot39]|uniref:hypothetical protein n=1 Tax=Pseudorhodoferax sp. LjRoot39 TaxID=3342328 RepID=UPI003ECD935C